MHDKIDFLNTCIVSPIDDILLYIKFFIYKIFVNNNKYSIYTTLNFNN